MSKKVVIIGLGNPDTEYGMTRHNIGKRVVSALATLLGRTDFAAHKKLQAEILKIGEVILAKPLTYMNESGTPTHAVWEYYQDVTTEDFSQLYIVHDDLDIPLGSYKIQQGTGPKGHNGLESIYQRLGTKNFWHVRIGVDNRSQDDRIPGIEYVLQKFSRDEEQELEKVFERLLPELQSRLSMPY